MQKNIILKSFLWRKGGPERQKCPGPMEVIMRPCPSLPSCIQRTGAYSNQIRARGSPGHCLHGAQLQTVWKHTETHPEAGD